jgi:hypothetical protein
MPQNVNWARSLATTITNYLKEEELACFRNFKFWSMIVNNGRTETGMSGETFQWQIQYRNHLVSGNTGETMRSFARENLWKNATLGWRGLQATDAIYNREQLANRGAQALVKVASGMKDRLIKSMNQKLGAEWVIDGEATGNEDRLVGIETMFGATQTIDVTGTGATARTANSADPFYYPNDTYAGLSTVLANYGGSLTSATFWPNGSSDPETDFWTPVIVNGVSSYFGASTWKDNCMKALREAIHQTQRNDTMEDQVDMCIMNRRLYIEALNSLDSKERVVVTRDNGLRSYGFKDVFEFDGVECTKDEAVPADTAYGLSTGNISFKSLQDNLLEVEGPFYDEETQQFRYAVTMLGNLCFKSPRNFFKIRTA